MINFSDPNIQGVWFIEVSDDSDWLMALIASPKGNKVIWRLSYRDIDCKSWHRQNDVPGASIAETITKIRIMLDLLGGLADGKPYEILRGDKPVDDFVRELMKAPWMHTREVPLQ